MKQNCRYISTTISIQYVHEYGLFRFVSPVWGTQILLVKILGLDER